MRFKITITLGLFGIFISLLFPGCQSTVDQLTTFTCKTVETNIARCSQLIADDISDKNTNKLAYVNEVDL